MLTRIDPRVQLANLITEAESSDGLMRFKIKDGGEVVVKLRSWEFAFTTVHIMPKGFYLAVEPSLVVDEDFEVFSIVLGGGRALTRHFAFSVGYAQFVTGDRTFNRAAVVGLQYIH